MQIGQLRCSHSNFINAGIITLSGIMFIRLAFYFPRQRPSWQPWQRLCLIFTYTLAGAAIRSFLGSRYLLWRQGVVPLVQRLDAFWFKTSVYLLLAGVIIVILRLILGAFILPNKPRLKRETRIMLLAFTLGLPAVWLGVHGGFGGAEKLAALAALADARYLFLAVPFAFAAITLRYHTFAGAERWLVLVLLLAVSGLAANIALILLFWQTPARIRDFPVPPQLILLLLFFGVGLFWIRQNEWQGWLGRVFQWERVGYNEVRRFGHLLAAKSYDDTAQLGQQITDALRQALSVEGAALWLEQEDGRTRLLAHSGDWTPPDELAPPEPLPPTTPFPLRGVLPDWLQALASHTAVILPLTAARHRLGLLAVGRRWDSAVFDDRDLGILDLIAQQAAMFLHNVQQMERVRAADKQMLQIQANTRRRVAQDLHDYILPSLGQLPLTLQTGLNYLETSPDKTRPLLEQSIERLQENAGRIRRIQQSLVIRPLQYGLAVYLEEMAQRFRQQTGITLNLTLPPNPDEAIPNHTSRELIYAVWQQALDNIQAHAQAAHVDMTLALNDHTVQFSICDDGVGVSQQQREQAAANGRFGLQSMQTRLESAGGQFDFDSAPGRGTCVKGELPLP